MEWEQVLQSFQDWPYHYALVFTLALLCVLLAIAINILTAYEGNIPSDSAAAKKQSKYIKVKPIAKKLKEYIKKFAEKLKRKKTINEEEAKKIIIDFGKKHPSFLAVMTKKLIEVMMNLKKSNNLSIESFAVEEQEKENTTNKEDIIKLDKGIDLIKNNLQNPLLFLRETAHTDKKISFAEYLQTIKEKDEELSDHEIFKDFNFETYSDGIAVGFVFKTLILDLCPIFKFIILPQSGKNPYKVESVEFSDDDKKKVFEKSFYPIITQLEYNPKDVSALLAACGISSIIEPEQTVTEDNKEFSWLTDSIDEVGEQILKKCDEIKKEKKPEKPTYLY